MSVYKYGRQAAQAHSDEVEAAHTRSKFEYFRKAEAEIEAEIEAGLELELAEYRPAPIRKRKTVAECGTHSGWARHVREGSVPCRKCLDARAVYQRRYRASKSAA
jgi:hypothetical protein